MSTITSPTLKKYEIIEHVFKCHNVEAESEEEAWALWREADYDEYLNDEVEDGEVQISEMEE